MGKLLTTQPTLAVCFLKDILTMHKVKDLEKPVPNIHFRSPLPLHAVLDLYHVFIIYSFKSSMLSNSLCGSIIH